MKRIISWIVLFISVFISGLVIYAVNAAVFYVASLFNGNFIRILYYTFVGALVIALYYVVMKYAAKYTIALSQKICKSQKGSRYKLVGFLYAIYYAVNVGYGIFSGQVQYNLQNLFFALLFVVFGIVIAVYGTNTAVEQAKSDNDKVE